MADSRPWKVAVNGLAASQLRCITTSRFLGRSALVGSAKRDRFEARCFRSVGLRLQSH